MLIIMLSQGIGRINPLLLRPIDEHCSLRQSPALRTSNTSRRKLPSRSSASTPKPKYLTEGTLIRQEITHKYHQLLQQIFRAKCCALGIEFNEAACQAFIKAFATKNKFMGGEISGDTVSFNDFGFSEPCIPKINEFLTLNPKLIIIKLAKNAVNPNNLARLETVKQLFLGNCRLGNDCLQALFRKLEGCSIEKLSLSSPELKDRNTLTRYKALISLIQSSRTLATLELANMDIQPDCQIIEACRNTAVRHLDLSDNTNVRGSCHSLLSLSLARNAITVPFTYPMLPNELTLLNLAHNRIPNYQFKEFLKYSYFSNLKQLVVDYVRLEGDLLCFQLYLEQAHALLHLSMVGCELIQAGFQCIAHGVKHNRSLESLNLSWNRVLTEKTADYLAHMLQGGPLKEIRMRHCDIKDNLGHHLFRNIRKSKTLEKIDVMNNLLGDRTAKTLCGELKYCKSLIAIQLEENIVKYSDIHEINSYLQSNKYTNNHQLDKEYKQLQQANAQIVEANIILNTESEKIAELEKETEALHFEYIKRFKVENEERKKRLKNNIYNIRDSENQLVMDITLLEALPSLTELNSAESRKESFISNHHSFNNL